MPWCKTPEENILGYAGWIICPVDKEGSTQVSMTHVASSVGHWDSGKQSAESGSMGSDIDQKISVASAWKL